MRRVVLAASAAALGGAMVGSLWSSQAAVGEARKPKPAPVEVHTLGTSTTGTPISVDSEGSARAVTFRQLTVQPGASGGWHTHAGEQIAVITQGELTRYGPDCRPRVFRAGDSVQEPADPKDIHLGVNEGSEPLVLVVVDLTPQDAPLAVPAANPGCPGLRD